MYDVAVIGGGPGGYAAAIRASQLGGRVVLFEAGDIGGTCVNRGCIPTKVWHRSAYLLHQLRSADAFGVKANLEGMDYAALKERKNGVVGDIRMGMEGLLANNGVDLITEKAILKSPREMEAGGRTFEAAGVILASGSSIAFPDVPGLEDAAMTSNQALDMDEPPASLLIVGAGPIQVEFATFFGIFGTNVTLIEKDRRILPREDGDVSQRIAQGLRELGVEILTRTSLQSVKPAAGGFEAVLEGPGDKPVIVERILIGDRNPNVSGMGLENIGVKLNPDGGIDVNAFLESSVRNIYAIGDCTGGWMLSHAASSMAVVAAENAMGRSGKYSFHTCPRSIWTIPEVGSVGLSEEEAEKSGRDVETGAFPFAINGLGMVRDEMAGEVKMVFDPEFGEILGVHIVGAGATELVGEAVLAMQLECTVQEFARGVRAHPTFSEAMVDAARDAKGWALYLPRE